MHITVRKAADGRLVLSQCQKDHLYHCPFCQPSIFKPRDYASVLTHIESHRLKAVLHREFTIFICHLECREAKHFHCPYCPKTYVNRSDFTKHIPHCESVCYRAPGSTARAPDVTSASARAPDVTSASARAPDVTSASARAPDVTSASARAPDVTSASARAPDVTSASARAPDVTSASARAPDVTSASASGSACPAVKPAVKRKIKCCNCSLWLNKKKLRKHQLRKHTSAEKGITAHSNLKAQCLDQDNWGFAEDKHIYPVSPSVLIREMLTKQEMILEQQTLILRLLQTAQQNGAEYAIEGGLLPLKDQQSLQRLETDLQGADFKLKLINHLSLVGGCDVKDVVWRLMRHTISNALAKNMNWRGVNRKISLGSLRLREVLIAVVRKNPLTSKASESDVESVMKKWLQLAAYREGGRRRRDRSVVAPVP
ncbi:uncharacterized protein LOC110499268 isoform X1 [Oncorhynchus mykiss]|uniref:C2H2-type domain-containing protein n=1 Tax=Oncorhynchus mykiss TaxID=8022 RepID=A0A8C7U7T2_ONCMY|nr:uncharacterized protein LOC110499268 isoform X1 [Oncorhynchus mykiss]